MPTSIAQHSARSLLCHAQERNGRRPALALRGLPVPTGTTSKTLSSLGDVLMRSRDLTDAPAVTARMPIILAGNLYAPSERSASSSPSRATFLFQEEQGGEGAFHPHPLLEPWLDVAPRTGQSRRCWCGPAVAGFSGPPPEGSLRRHR